MKNPMLLLLAVTAFIAIGCESEISADKSNVKLLTLDATYAAKPVKVDGVLDDPVWKIAKTYPLQLPADREDSGEKLSQPGEFMLAWDDKNLYIAAKFTDLDIVAEGTEDGQHHYKLGDLMEVFIWPGDYSWYWELYATPASMKTTFFFPAPGRLGLPSGFGYKCELQVASEVNGTLNDWKDKDTGWTTEMAVPLTELTKRGEKFGPGSNWRILIARYNYDFYLDRTGPELSASSKLSKASYHLRDEYGKINFVK